MIIVRAPVRISIGGGGTDVPSYYSKFEGEWTSAAINKYVYIIVNKRFENSLRVSYSETEIAKEPNQINHPIVREAIKLLKIDGGIEIISIADVPSSTGLGTSGSFCVSLLTALHTYLENNQKRNFPSKEEIAEEACHIAIDILGEPSGKQDEYISAVGGLTSFSVSRKGNVTINPLYPNNISPEIVSELEHNLLMFYTGIRRKSSPILKHQAEATKKGKGKTVKNLHRVKEIGQKIKKALEKGNLNEFGKLLDIHWQEKIKRKGTSNPEINKWYKKAKEAGALGGKLMGAGGGGFFLFYCNKNKNKLREAMKKVGLREESFRFDLQGAKVMANFV